MNDQLTTVAGPAAGTETDELTNVGPQLSRLAYADDADEPDEPDAPLKRSWGVTGDIAAVLALGGILVALSIVGLGGQTDSPERATTVTTPTTTAPARHLPICVGACDEGTTPKTGSDAHSSTAPAPTSTQTVTTPAPTSTPCTGDGWCGHPCSNNPKFGEYYCIPPTPTPPGGFSPRGSN